MNTFSPTFAQFLLHCSSGKIEPAFVEEGAKFVWARHPDKHGRGIGYHAKTRFTLTQLFLRYFALGNVARHPAREGRFATFVQLDAAITRHPACASVRPRDAIFVLILAATALEHVLHNLLRTFAILGVHDLEHSVKALSSDSAKPNNLLHCSVTQSSSSWMFQSHTPRFAASAA